MGQSDKITGGCMCGAVRYTADGPPMHAGYCHCRSCRHHTGAAVAGMLVFDAARVLITNGTLTRYTSSPGIARGFCAQCGTSLSWHGHGLTSLHIGTLDDPEAHPPNLYWRHNERPAWCNLAPDLPKVRMVFPDASAGQD